MNILDNMAVGQMELKLNNDIEIIEESKTAEQTKIELNLDKSEDKYKYIFSKIL